MLAIFLYLNIWLYFVCVFKSSFVFFLIIIIIIIIYLLRGNVQYVNKYASEQDKKARSALTIAPKRHITKL